MKIKLEVIGTDDLAAGVSAVKTCVQALENLGETEDIVSMMTALSIINVAIILHTSKGRDMALEGADIMHSTVRDSIENGMFIPMDKPH